MTDTATIRKGISYVADSYGDKLAIQFSLKNKAIRKVVEDFLDTLDVAERDNEPSRLFEEVHKEILAKYRTDADA